jgi:hypothetical protein
MLSYEQALKDMQYYSDELTKAQTKIERLRAALDGLIEPVSLGDDVTLRTIKTEAWNRATALMSK